MKPQVTREEAEIFFRRDFTGMHQSIFQKLCEADNFETVEELTQVSEEEQECRDFFPMYGSMWLVESSDEYLQNKILENLKKLSDLGIRIYRRENDQMGDEIWIGVEGAGFDFYEEIWIPMFNILYRS